jgi:hypothetical protein
MSLEQESIMKKMTWIVAALLAGCGGGTDVVSFPGPAPEPQPFPDAFVAEVARVVAATPDDAEAAAIDSMAAVTAPENSEAATL